MFVLEISARGLYRVRFPKRYPILEPGSRMGGFPDKLLVGMKPDLSGFTKFQLRVYSTLRKVPAGTILTYGELASRAGFPGAARAVGTAMRKNRLPIMIPCHRVLPASGGLGNYSAGNRWKLWLLNREKLHAQRATGNAQRRMP